MRLLAGRAPVVASGTIAVFAFGDELLETLTDAAVETKAALSHRNKRRHAERHTFDSTFVYEIDTFIFP